MAAPDLFDAYFRRADVDRDGRISGQEAVSFFQGANLNREVLAKVWQYADKGQTGFLSRPEFYNALKLVTVAQSGRELTPTIVSKALSEPAASQIPAPQMQFTSVPTPVAPQTPGMVRPVRPLGPPAQQQYPSGPLSPLSRTPTPPTPGVPANIPADWSNNKSSSWLGPGSNNNLSGQVSQTKAAFPSQDIFQGSSLTGANAAAPKTSAEPDLFGGDVFTAVPVKPQTATSQTHPKGLVQMSQSGLASPNQTAQPRGPQSTGQPDLASFAIVPTSSAPVAASKQLQPVASSAGQAEHGFAAPIPVIDGTKAWPKMTDAIVRRYTKIFLEVDTDKDGKISGSQARDLFLSWQLPREVLKQIWDLSDQDHDSMLSLREFCVALYLMERHREGRALPASISAAFYFDESGVQALRISEAQVAAAQNSAGHNLPAWRQNPGMLQTAGPGLQPRAVGMPPRGVSQAPGAGLPPRPVSQGMPLQVPGAPVQVSPPAPGRDGLPPTQPAAQQKSKAPVLEMDLVNQLSADDQLTLQSKHQEAADAEKKVLELEKQIMDSKEKMEFYRTKLQEIVLFKTRCDNRLTEITERAAADKREVETMTKRYNAKFKQAGDSQSRLLADEAAFRDVQERRLELFNAILRVEQGGDDNALLQSRADKLQTDLDELRKSLNSKCKQFGVRIKPTLPIELPYGWQPGVQENAAPWDDDWDKFDDEGFAYVQEFMEEGTRVSDAAKPKADTNWDENGHSEDGFDFSTADEEVHVDEKPSNGNHDFGEVSHDSTANGDSSPGEDMSSSSPRRHLQTSILDATNENTKDSQSHGVGFSSWPSDNDAFADDGGDWASAFSRRSDDTDSTVSWGKSDVKTSEEPGFTLGKSGTATSFEFNDPFDMLSSPAQTKDAHEEMPSFGPIRTKERSSDDFDNSVPSTPLYNNASLGQVSSGVFFDESVPSTPFHNNVSRGQEPSPDFFRFDSFSSNANDIGHTSDSFTRFDSFSSTAGGQVRGFTSFDENDPFAGTGPFGGQASRRSSDASSSFS
eukprot:c22237_g2_i1 orf=94-3177(+)